MVKKPRCYTKSPTVQDMFRTIPGLISCAGVTNKWGLLSCTRKAINGWWVCSKCIPCRLDYCSLNTAKNIKTCIIIYPPKYAHPPSFACTNLRQGHHILYMHALGPHVNHCFSTSRFTAPTMDINTFQHSIVLLRLLATMSTLNYACVCEAFSTQHNYPSRKC